MTLPALVDFGADIIDPRFRREAVKLLKEAGCAGTSDVNRWIREDANWLYFNKSTYASHDGLHHMRPEPETKVSIYATITLAGSASDTDSSWLEAFPEPSAPGYICCNGQCSRHTNSRVLAGEVLERQERHEDAIIWAQAELADPFVISNASKLRAGQLLGRAHAARGQHALAIAAFDAAVCSAFVSPAMRCGLMPALPSGMLSALLVSGCVRASTHAHAL